MDSGIPQLTAPVAKPVDKRLARRHGLPLILVQLLLTVILVAGLVGFVIRCGRRRTLFTLWFRYLQGSFTSGGSADSGPFTFKGKSCICSYLSMAGCPRMAGCLTAICIRTHVLSIADHPCALHMIG